MSTHRLRCLVKSDESAIEVLLQERWGDRMIVSGGKVLDAARLPGFIAFDNEQITGLITVHLAGRSCEVVTLDAFTEGQGIGTRLLLEAERFAASHDCERIWLVTTNDNTDAMRFYQKRGFRIVAVHQDAIQGARLLKPQIPWVGAYGIPIVDEIELDKVITLGDAA